jgi:hypothetical protein
MLNPGLITYELSSTYIYLHKLIINYLSPRSNLLDRFSNPFRIPDRIKLKRSTGSTNSIKWNRASTFSVAKFMIDTSTFAARMQSTKVKDAVAVGVFLTGSDHQLIRVSRGRPL